MFFQVNSSNRHAVRKLLTSSGMDSSVVRNLRNGQLGKSLYEAVRDGKIPMDSAAAASNTSEVDSTGNVIVQTGDFISDDIATLDDAAEPAPAAAPAPKMNGNGKHSEPLGAANQLAAAMEAIMASMAPKAAPIDADTVRDIVREVLKTEPRAGGTIEIKVGDKVNTVEGSQHAMFEHVVRIASTRVQGRRLHTWLVGPSGSGKSFLAGSAAKALSLDYYSTSAIQSKYDLIGFVSPTGADSTLRTPFRNAFENGGLFAWDDIDASDPRAFVAFNEALSNGRFPFPDKVVEQHADFVCVASANTWGNGATADYVGRNKIDGATLSRFVRVTVDYDEELERDMVGGHEWARFIQRVRGAVKAEGIKVLVTPRHTLQGVALLAAGLDRKTVEQYTVFAGLDSDTVARLRRAA